MRLTEASGERQNPSSDPPAVSAERDNSTLGKMRRILETRETSFIGDLSVDFLTARTVVRVYDGLPERKREKFARLTAKQMVHKAFQLDK